MEEERELIPASPAAAGEGERIKKRNTAWMTLISVYSMMYFPLGVGPAFAYTGWVPGLLMLTYSAWASYSSGVHLNDLCTKGSGPIADTYPKLARIALGVQGERFITATQSGLYFMCGVFNIAYMPANFEQLFHTGPSTPEDRIGDEKLFVYLVATWGTMVLGTLLPTYHDTIFIALFSAVVSTMNAALQLLVVGLYQRDLCGTTQKVSCGSSFIRVVSALPAISYTFGGHGVFPEEMREMKDPKQFSKIVRWLYLASLPWYYLCSVVSYYAYGDTIQGNPIANWPQGLWLTKVAAFFSLVGALVISVTSNQATLMAIDQLDPGLLEKRVSRRQKRFLMKFLFVTCQLLVAMVLRRTPLQFIQGFMGSFGVGCLTFVFPFVLALATAEGYTPQNVVFCLLGMLVSLTGIVTSLYNMATVQN
ncbi:amino acid transporter domain-containing protein [Chloropicon primus]|uniref:Amino acid transporter transmembrane domain-containing protein n=1 Tax=Chloropicon primus TaxID=1764295 RepID=A0A5B8MKM4_9CHLO|nr:hypothetical protein A3770_04p31220 [Chloropicon primus]UPQ99815.1 amino acid transporter domain-containing protein [Chloropicon primus]|mmetsp:Transcript_10567/g.29869  ORF Transcript_10567/g.29869 Transcript_10567/m.29869 type:complete len:421 (+) Transcript_10567:154-1416(+)|eukprot:QDZ20604.1 hypothetical protein A3770_04p31220 [Chloropicon primus]